MIFYDFREESSGVPKMLIGLRVPARRTGLVCGDYVVGEIGVERKSIEDYLASKTSGHLDKQLYAMSYNFELSYLFIEGYVSQALMYRKMKREPFISSLIGSSLKRADEGKRGRVVTVNLETKWDSALALKYLHDKVVKGESRMPRLRRVKPGAEGLMVYIVSSLPGIGEKRAKDMLNKHKTLRNLFKSLDWTEVKGIGDKINFELQSLLDREYGAKA